MTAIAIFAASADKNGLLSEQTAAWVQAIGTVAAIAGAVWLQDRQRAADKREKDSVHREALLVVAYDTLSIFGVAALRTSEGQITYAVATFLRNQMESKVESFEKIEGFNYPPKVFDIILDITRIIHSGILCIDVMFPPDSDKNPKNIDPSTFGTIYAELDDSYQKMRGEYGLPPDHRAAQGMKRAREKKQNLFASSEQPAEQAAPPGTVGPPNNAARSS